MISRKFVIQWALIVLSLGLGVAILGYLFSKTDAEETAQNLIDFGILPFLGYIAVFLLMFTFSSWRWQLIINQHVSKKNRIGLWRVYIDRLAGFSASYLTPAAQVGGEPVRIALLSTGNVRVPIKQATSSVVLDVAFELAAYVAFIVMGATLAIYHGLGDGDSLWVIMVTLLTFLAVLLSFFYLLATGRRITHHVFRLIPWKRATRWDRWKRSATETEEMMTTFLREDKVLVAKVLVLSFIVMAFRMVDVFYLMYMFDVDMTFSQAFLISTLPAIALLMPIPGSVGVLEGGYAAIFAVLFVPLNPVAYVIIVRARDLLFIMLGLTRILAKGREFIEEKLLQLTGN